MREGPNFILLIRITLILSCTIPSLTMGEINAQHEDRMRLSFHHLDPATGLSEGTNAWVYRDSRGFTWISSIDGLNRFDGRTVKVYKPDPVDPNSITNSIITSNFFEDEDGNLWFTSYTGLHVYIRKLDHFQTFQLNDLDGQAISQDYFAFHLSGGKLWVRTGVRDRGLAHLFDIESHNDRIIGRIQGQRNIPLINEDGKITAILSSMRSNENGFLISTLDSLGEIEKTTFFFEGTNERFQPITRTYNALQTEPNTVWIGSDHGLIRFDPLSLEYDFVAKDYGKVKTAARFKDRLYVGTSAFGLLIIDPGSGEVINRMMPEKDDDYSINFSAISKLTVDQNDCLWVSYFEDGNAGGLDFADLNKNRFPLNLDFQMNGNPPSHLAAGPDGSTFISNGNRLFRHERNGSIQTWDMPGGISALKQDRSGNSVWIVYRDPETRDYFIRKMDARSGQLRNITGLKNRIFDLIELADGTLLIATTDGVYKFREGKSSEPVFFEDMENLKKTWTLHLHLLTEEYIAVAANLDKLILFKKEGDNYQMVKEVQNLGDCNANYYFPEKQLAWFSSSLGMFELDLTTLDYRILNLKNAGLPAEKFYSIIRDNDGYFWLKTKRELLKYDLTEQSIKRFNVVDGVSEVTGIEQPAIYTTDGEIWMGGKNGINVFYPDKIPDIELTAKPQIIGITINDAPLDTELSHNMVDSLVLPYSQNTIAFDFVACDYSDPGNVKFEYRMNGLDKQWVNGGDYGFARYFSLPAGEYTFEVRSSNAEGAWSKSRASIYLTIKPPFWATTFARVMYVVLFLGSMQLWRVQTRKKQERKLNEEKKKLEQERRINDELRKVDKIKDQFLANTSHELRTPLNGIIGLAESLIDGASGPLPEKTVRNLAMITNAGRRLSNLINDILDFSKLKTHDLSLSMQDVDLHVAADVVLTVLHPLADSKKLTLINEIPPDIDIVRGDENRIQQILYNLVGNAIKFTDEGSVVLYAQPEGEFLTIEVRDTGIGIAEDKHEEIFRSFEQGDGSTTRTYGGSGLGLSVTRQLVELHGGKIWLRSSQGKGSTFFVSLPLSTISREEFIASSTSEATRIQHLITDDMFETIRPEHSEGDKGRTSSILVVDDEPVNRQVLENHLTTAGYQVMQAANGKEALELVENHEFDLVVLDIMMPGISGFEVCRKLRERFLPSYLPIIMLTAKNRIADLVEGFSVGANDYLAKPFSKDELLTRINTHLNLKNINYASGKFVPYAFLNAIGRERITDVELGDHAEVFVTVLFSDIRDYTTLSESMTPSENFKFVNQYVGIMGPIIQSHNGFVNQYLGDGIMAIFPGKPDDALQAAIKMMLAIEEFNAPRISKGEPAIRIGIGMHTGPLIMGIIGDDTRVDPATIADTVNTSSRLEGLTKHYKTRILISEESKDHLSNPEKFGLRHLGSAKVKGKKAPIGIYECYLGDDEESRIRKAESGSDFEIALGLFHQRKFDRAAALFEAIFKANPNDRTAHYFMQTSLNYRDLGVPEEWEGIEDVQSK